MQTTAEVYLLILAGLIILLSGYLRRLTPAIVLLTVLPCISLVLLELIYKTIW